MKLIINSIVFVVTILMVTLTVFMSGALMSEPNVNGEQSVNASSAKYSKQFAKRLFDAIDSNTSELELIVSEQELASLTALANRTSPQLSSQTDLSSYGMRLAISYDTQLPEPWRYLNIESSLLPSDVGIRLAQVKLGRWRIRGTFFLTLMEWALNLTLGKQLGTDLVMSIQSTAFSEQEGRIKFNVPNKFYQQQNKPSRILALRDKLAIFGNTDPIKEYHDHLKLFTDEQRDNNDLAAYFRHVFTFAHQRSASLNNIQIAAENRAALLALAVYFGSNKFELMLGDIAQLNRQQFHRRHYHRSHVTLRDRVDLQKHFIYSIAIQIFSSLHTSDVLGEFKELLDVNDGGSGFSFADLMADRAGTRLAKLLTTPRDGLRDLQRQLVTISDAQLLPDINGLPEGLDEQTFNAYYQNIDAEPYMMLVHEIDSRLRATKLYQTTDS